MGQDCRQTDEIISDEIIHKMEKEREVVRELDLYLVTF